ncbi:MAG: UDP-N-acetylmuramoyl-tripeptide--D-alanyl-D-alanine ligase [Bacteroidetes bacterium]|nr:UDP-N-acetylmuramoyl-tripeptide--D-alanyl-D-alanine ligase [Bacteroidota bacterium]
MFKSIEYLYSLFIKHPHICTDTRNVSQGSIFFALKGENFNANKFAEDAIKNGSSYAVIDEPEYKKNDNYILVENVLDTLQQLAAWHRKQLTIPIIGITGTNGKTTTKELIFSVLSKKYNTSATKGNFNNHIGVPLSILDISKNIDIAIIEMGANHIGEIGELCKIALPDFGIITNIGKAHIEGFGSLEGIVNTKKELYDSVRLSHGKVFVCKDSSLLLKLSEDIERLTYGVFPDSDCRGEIEESNPLLKVKWYCKSEKKVINISTKLVGYFNFENVMAAICVGEYFGVCSEDIKNAIENYTPSNNRSQFIKTKKNTIIMDAYNANPSSMEASVRNFLQNSFDNKLAIIGDMLELGVDAEKEHKKIIDLLENSDLNKVLLVGKHFSELKISKKFTAFPGVNEAAEWIAKEGINGYNILIKGSRGIKLEKLLELL